MKNRWSAVVVLTMGVLVCSPTFTADAQPRTSRVPLDNPNAGCAGGIFGCDPDLVYGGRCEAGYHRSECTVTKTGGNGNCFHGVKFPHVDGDNYWVSSNPHDCT